MLKTLFVRARQGHRTMAWPKAAPNIPPRLRGLPTLSSAACASDCTACASVCPTQAVQRDGDKLQIDLGNCLFCGECEEACPGGAIHFAPEYRLATSDRESLVVREDERYLRAHAIGEELRRLYGRSFKIRQVSAGGCNACEADVNVLTTLAFDLGRFGIQIVASPRHADALLLTGPVSENMREAALETYRAMPEPRIVIAVGACAIGGGPFAGHPEVHGGASALFPIDLYVPGCPPHPMTILDGLVRLLGRLDGSTL